MNRKPAFAVLLLSSLLPLVAAGANDPDAEPAFAWKKIPVAGAVCGNGKPYSVFVREGDPSRWLLEFMGGGACWNAESCAGANPRTIVFELPFVPHAGGILAREAWNPVADHSVIFFPYCTGDVHVGNHVARYGTKAIAHVGRGNLERALEKLAGDPATDFTLARQVVVHGASAGALGALFHAQTIDRMLEPWVDRVLLADSPGLHFGDRFWEKFTPELLADYAQGLERAGLRLDPSSGLIAGLIPEVCRRLPMWRTGVMQSTRDSVMSTGFGEITPGEHARRLLGPAGVAALTSDPTDHCSSWIPDSSVHTFFVATATSWSRAGGVSAQEYLRSLIDGTDGRNHLPRELNP